VDEYEGMDDVGYVRRLVPHQEQFVMRQLDFAQDAEVEGYFPTSSELPYNPSGSGISRSSASSSASLSSPGMSSCKHNHASPAHDNAAQQDQQQQLGSSYQVRAGSGYGSSPTAAAATGDAAWDSGPAGIVFAEPVTNPTKDSRRSSISEPKCSLSRVESLSNSFIDELESCEGGGDRDASGRLSEVCSVGGDASTPQRRSGADGSSDSAAGGRCSTDAAAGGYDDVIDLSPPSPPPDCAADAGIDLSNIFELGLRGSSRTSSVDVLYGSVRCWSETDSEQFGIERPRSQGAGSTSAPGLLSGLMRPKPASKLQPLPPQPQQQQELPQQEQQQQQETVLQAQQLDQQQQQQQVEPQQNVQQQIDLQPDVQQEQPKAATEPAEQQQQQET
jgi:hypothetical protein